MNQFEALITSVINEMLQRGAANLTQLIGTEVRFLDTTLVADPGSSPVAASPYIAVRVDFTEGLEGSMRLVLPHDEAAAIVRLMTAGMEIDEEDLLGELGLSAIGEAMNQFMAGGSRAMSERLGTVVHISPPTLEKVEDADEEEALHDDPLVLSARAKFGEDASGHLFYVMERSWAEQLVSLLEPGQPEEEPSSAAQVPPPPPSGAPTSNGHPGGAHQLGRLAGVGLEVTVELGRATLPIRDLLSLDGGSVLRLGRGVDEPVDLLVNGILTARGEIVVVDGRLGLRITEMAAD